MNNMRINELCTAKSSALALNKLEDNIGQYALYGASGFVKNIDFYKFEENYISIVKDGAGVGRVRIHPEKSSILGTMQCVIPNENVDIKWLYYCLVNQNLGSNFTGATIPHIYFKDYGSRKVNVPSLDRQKHIVDVLDRLTDTIKDCKHQLKLLDELVEAKFEEMFGEVEEFIPLNESCEFIKDGTHQTPTYTDDIVKGVKFVSSKDVTKKYINWKNVKYIPNDLHVELTKYIKPQKGDILLAKNGTIGVAAEIDCDENFSIYVSVALLRLKNKDSSKFMTFVLNTEKSKYQFLKSLKGVGVPNLHLSEIKKILIPVIDAKMQIKFTNIINEVNIEKDKLNEYLDNLKQLFDKKMQEYFG